MALSYFSILIHEILNKYPDIVPEQEPLIILDSNYAVYMSKNGKYTNHTSHLSRRVHFVRNGVKWKMHNIDWCEIGL